MELWVAVGSLLVAILSVFIAVKSYVQAKISTGLAEEDYKKKNEPVKFYLIDGFSCWKRKSNRKCFFAISISNSSSLPASLVKVELHLSLYASDGTTTKIILQPTSVSLPGSDNVFTVVHPINVLACSTESIWVSYVIPLYIMEGFKIDVYEVVFTSVNGLRFSVSQYVMKEVENVEGKG